MREHLRVPALTDFTPPGVQAWTAVLNKRLESIADTLAMLEGRDGRTPAFTSNVDLQRNRITNLAPSEDEGDAVTRGELEEAGIYAEPGVPLEINNPIVARGGLVLSSEPGVEPLAPPSLRQLQEVKLTSVALGTLAAPTQAAFWETATSITGDNAFWWDNVNKRLGLGVGFSLVAVPGNRLTLQGNNQNDATVGARTASASASDGPRVRYARSQGTIGAETAVTIDNVLGTFQWLGADPAFVVGAEMRALSNQAWAPGAHGTRLEFRTTADGSVSVTERVRITDAGHVELRSAAALPALELRLYEPGVPGSYTSFKSPALAANLDYTLPATQTVGTFLRNDAGPGTLTWAALTSADMALTVSEDGVVQGLGSDIQVIDFLDDVAFDDVFVAGNTAFVSTNPYARRTGRPGGQILSGGTGTGEDLTLLSNTLSDSRINFGLAATSAYDETTDRWGFGTTTFTERLNIDGNILGLSSMTVYGGDATGESLTLQPNRANTITGQIITEGQVHLWPNHSALSAGSHVNMLLYDRTVSFGTNNVILRGMRWQPTVDFGGFIAGFVIPQMVSLGGTWTSALSGPIGDPVQVFLIDATFRPSATNAVPISPLTFFHSPILEVNTGITSPGTSAAVQCRAFNDVPLIRTANAAGNFTVSDVTGLRSSPTLSSTVAGGVAAITTRRAVWVQDLIFVSTGTVTVGDNIGVDVENMVVGVSGNRTVTSVYGVRSALAQGTNRWLFRATGTAESAILGSMRLGSGSAVATGGSILHVDGGLTHKRTTFSNANYTVLLTDLIVAQIGTMSAARTVTLPTVASAAAGKVYTVADESNTVTVANEIIVDGNGAETISGFATQRIRSGFGAVVLYCTGAAWVLIDTIGTVVGV